MYTLGHCGHCRRAKAILEKEGVGFDEIKGDGDPAFRGRLVSETGGYSVPQIVIDGRPIGGARELVQLARSGMLRRLGLGPA